MSEGSRQKGHWAPQSKIGPLNGPILHTTPLTMTHHRRKKKASSTKVFRVFSKVLSLIRSPQCCVQHRFYRYVCPLTPNFKRDTSRDLLWLCCAVERRVCKGMQPATKAAVSVKAAPPFTPELKLWWFVLLPPRGRKPASVPSVSSSSFHSAVTSHTVFSVSTFSVYAVFACFDFHPSFFFFIMFFNDTSFWQLSSTCCVRESFSSDARPSEAPPGAGQGTLLTPSSSCWFAFGRRLLTLDAHLLLSLLLGGRW